MDGDLVEIAIGVILYVAYLFFNRNKSSEEPDEPSAAELVVGAQALGLRVEEIFEELRTGGTQARTSAHLVARIVHPRVSELIELAEQFQAGTNYVSPWVLDAVRANLASFAFEVHQHGTERARGGPVSAWLGDTLVAAMRDWIDEGYGVVGASANLDVLSSQELTRSALRHVYAAWIPRLLADVSTAVLDPPSALAELRRLESESNLYVGTGVEPPQVIRGLVLGQIVEKPFRIPSDVEVLVTDSVGMHHALPLAVLAEDIHVLVASLVSEPFEALGRLSLRELEQISTRTLAADALSGTATTPLTEPAAPGHVAGTQQVAPSPRRERASLYDAAPTTTLQRSTARQLSLNEVRDAIVMGELLRIR